jgi:hypothetical protein
MNLGFCEVQMCAPLKASITIPVQGWREKLESRRINLLINFNMAFSNLASSKFKAEFKSMGYEERVWHQRRHCATIERRVG